ncbi:hypothetical protein DSO57_1034925 [Entomophthora muscae]|uniref:Uncharacterized protein n=1 Tax=Entomophthora muscae TaxID=34485 RepID=A0ACC2SCC3_9FUNG|nr:hypothetical protein DSO57_1034925 [Entomophthora muscae]
MLNLMLQRRTSNSLREKIEKCSSNCKMQVCKKRCELRYTFENDHSDKLTQGYSKCNAQDQYCKYKRFYEEVGLTADEIWQQYNANKVAKYCKEASSPDQCLAEALEVPEETVVDSIDCRESKCSDASSMLNIATCELECQCDLIEPLLQSNYTLIIQRHKTKAKNSYSFHHSTSLLHFSVILLLFSLLF